MTDTPATYIVDRRSLDDELVQAHAEIERLRQVVEEERQARRQAEWLLKVICGRYQPVCEEAARALEDAVLMIFQAERRARAWKRSAKRHSYHEMRQHLRNAEVRRRHGVGRRG